MIRFIDLRGQITADDDPHFAFFDTILDRFLKFGGEQEWDSLDDFTGLFPDDGTDGMLDRCLRLIPKNYFEQQASQSPPPPNVKREELADDGREKLILFCQDSPARPNYEQTKGTTERDYLASLPLDDGRRLELHIGANSCAHFTAMLAAMATDDADEELERG